MKDIENLRTAIQEGVLSKDFELYERSRSADYSLAYYISFDIVLPHTYKKERPIEDVIIRGIRDKIQKTHLVKNFIDSHKKEI